MRKGPILLIVSLPLAPVSNQKMAASLAARVPFHPDGGEMTLRGLGL